MAEQPEPTASTAAGTDRGGRSSPIADPRTAVVAAGNLELRLDAPAPAVAPAVMATGADHPWAAGAARPATAAAVAVAALRRLVGRPDGVRRAQAGSDCRSRPPAVAELVDAPAWAGGAAPEAPGRSGDPRRGGAGSAARSARWAAARPGAEASAVQAPKAPDVRSRPRPVAPRALRRWSERLVSRSRRQVVRRPVRARAAPRRAPARRRQVVLRQSQVQARRGQQAPAPAPAPERTARATQAPES